MIGRRTMVALLVAVCGGCGGGIETYPVEGTVVAHDGTPLAGVQLVWRCDDPPLSAVAVTDREGRYQLGTYEGDDGAPAGEYHVIITEPQSANPDAPRPRRIALHYSDFDTSGLQFIVEPRSNRFDLRLDPWETQLPPMYTNEH